MKVSQHIRPDVLIVGAGPAGLAAALELRRRGIEKVLVVEREAVAGGVPRHCFHPGFGFYDRRRVLSGPRYAAEYVRMARKAGVTILTEATATEWEDSTSVRLSSPHGIHTIQAQAILLATGCRERPRPARLIAGSRPGGVYTTGSLQQVVYLKQRHAGKRAVVVGAEHVSFSALDTLAKGGCETVAMVTHFSNHQTYPPVAWWLASRRGVSIVTESRVVSVNGRERVESVDIFNMRSGERKAIACDTVVFTGDWIPDHELARLGGSAINRGTKGPEVDQCLRTSRRGVFAAGNLLRGAEMADTAALEGRYAAGAIVEFLKDSKWPENDNRVPIEVASPILWASPNAIDPSAPGVFPRNRLVFRVDRFIKSGTVRLMSGSDELVSKRFRRLIPNQWYGLPMALAQITGETFSLRMDE